jgi:hypothetical protein
VLVQAQARLVLITNPHLQVLVYLKIQVNQYLLYQYLNAFEIK